MHAESTYLSPQGGNNGDVQQEGAMEYVVQRHDPPVHDQRPAHAVDDDDAGAESQHDLHAEDAGCKPGRQFLWWFSTQWCRPARLSA